MYFINSLKTHVLPLFDASHGLLSHNYPLNYLNFCDNFLVTMMEDIILLFALEGCDFKARQNSCITHFVLEKPLSCLYLMELCSFNNFLPFTFFHYLFQLVVSLTPKIKFHNVIIIINKI